MTGIVIKAHAAQYKDPIVLKEGDVVVLGEKSTEPQWPDWIWATLAGKSGWIPVQFVTSDGLVREDYSAQELEASVGDQLELLKSLNGWYWALNLVSKELGWMPEENVKAETNLP